MTTTSDIIDVTPLAAEKLVDALKEQGEEGSLLRVMVMPGGNGGIQYMLGVEKEPADDDIVIDASNVKVLVDAESVPLVEGAQIDYVEGLMRSGFVISNPNVRAADAHAAVAAVVVEAAVVAGDVAAVAAAAEAANPPAQYKAAPASGNLCMTVTPVLLRQQEPGEGRNPGAGVASECFSLSSTSFK